MIDASKAYEKFYKLLEQIDKSDIPLKKQYEMYKAMESELEQKRQQAYSELHQY